MTPKPKPVLPITQLDVNLYVQINAEYKRLEKERDALNQTIMEALLAGADFPTNGPYLLVNQPQSRCKHTWKQICEDVLSLLGERLQEKAMALIEERLLDKADVPSLVVKPNPDWSGL